MEALIIILLIIIIGILSSKNTSYHGGMRISKNKGVTTLNDKIKFSIRFSP